ncbi:hypothetical protein HYC85_029179 [Camellia sinensis]|uniref:Uncharacterized protein n=1 Tax=Camellia sinensis TaxID=4442 RepID=A0A7J7FZM5_CAMSI|nr:hypothetical protein HYC85_029179 [Camellia sinensis]
MDRPQPGPNQWPMVMKSRQQNTYKHAQCKGPSLRHKTQLSKSIERMQHGVQWHMFQH